MRRNTNNKPPQLVLPFHQVRMDSMLMFIHQLSVCHSTDWYVLVYAYFDGHSYDNLFNRCITITTHYITIANAITSSNVT
jgi:hypothetical protein